MCQIYGLRETTTNILREHEGGRLKCWKDDNGEEYLPRLFNEDGSVKPEFECLPYVLDGRYTQFIDRSELTEAEAKADYFATGLERGNSTTGYTALSTLFLREHNRICGELAGHTKAWTDEQLFQTARMIVTALELKIVVEEYINHIRGRRVFMLDPTLAGKQDWYRTNWIALEFDLLYRWHSLVPDALTFGGKTYAGKHMLVNNRPLLECGLEGILSSASQQKAGRIGLFNTPAFLMQAELAAVNMSRTYRLCSFNDYRERFGLDRVTSFDELTSDATVRDALTKRYKNNIENLEFLIGLYAEEPREGALFGELMTTMVGHDAFTQALTNPLLSDQVFNRHTFAEYGLDLISRTNSLQDIAERNVAPGKPLKVSLAAL